MKCAALEIILDEEIVLSARNATTGNHECLDYIPGSALLGAVASTLYARLAREQAFQIFHAGKVRFGDGLPLTEDGEPSWPAPLSWHTDKHDRNGAGIEAVANLAVAGADNGLLQPQQVRNWWVTETGRRTEVRKHFRMKTAIDATTGRAATGQLFGYSSLQAGQRFLARIDADDEVPDATWQAILAAAMAGIRLGRSRTAQYGRVTVREHAGADIHPAAVQADGQRLLLWLLSDLAVRDAAGMPTLAPTGAALGFPEYDVDDSRTFVRTRRYSPYNATRRGYDAERQVLQAGSVIALVLREGSAAPAAATLAARVSAGLGLHRTEGLGRVALDPRLLATATPVPAPAPVILFPPAAQHVEPTPDTALLHFLRQRRDLAKQAVTVPERVHKQLAKLREFEQTSRNYMGIDPAVPHGPSASQWNRVADLAADASDREVLREKLFGDNGACPAGRDAWDIRTPRGDLRQLLESMLPAANQQHLIPAFAQLAREMAREKQEKR